MSKRSKLIAAIKNNPKGVRFDDACLVATWLLFEEKGGKGAHRAYVRPGEPNILVFQNRDGFIKPYQARQLIEMIGLYDDNNEEQTNG
jgi:hypothetical protein